MSSTVQQPPPDAPIRSGRLVGDGLRPKLTQPGATSTTAKHPRRFTAVPLSLLHDPVLNEDLTVLPSNYSFELHKTIHRIRESEARRVALQMPEGLLMYATTISDILRKHTSCEDTVVMGDVTYGACCVDDFSAVALGCDFLVHYGHSCLVPVTQCKIPMLYVFVHISFDTSHLLKVIRANFDASAKLALVGTIQFVDTLHNVREQLANEFKHLVVPQARPLSPGELLGCTAPTFQAEQIQELLYIGDGRFHLESVMIANPSIQAFRYDPYSKRITKEGYAHDEMKHMRYSAVAQASSAINFAIILGTLGRQGSPKILQRLLDAAKEKDKSAVVVLLSEITPAKIQTMEKAGIDAWIQIACPRLSIDWGNGYGTKPLLNPYEAFVALGKTQWREKYPMDFYAKNGGEWTNYYKDDVRKAVTRMPEKS